MSCSHHVFAGLDIRTCSKVCREIPAAISSCTHGTEGLLEPTNYANFVWDNNKWKFIPYSKAGFIFFDNDDLDTWVMGNK